MRGERTDDMHQNPELESNQHLLPCGLWVAQLLPYLKALQTSYDELIQAWGQEVAVPRVVG